jgi:hypothetical protein
MVKTMGEKRWWQKLTKVVNKPFTSPSYYPGREGDIDVDVLYKYWYTCAPLSRFFSYNTLLAQLWGKELWAQTHFW